MKKTKLWICIIIGVATLPLHGTTQEEITQHINDLFEQNKQKGMDGTRRLEGWSAFSSLGYDAFPAIYELLEEKGIEDRFLWNYALGLFSTVDGENLASA